MLLRAATTLLALALPECEPWSLGLGTGKKLRVSISQLSVASGVPIRVGAALPLLPTYSYATAAADEGLGSDGPALERRTMPRTPTSSACPAPARTANHILRCAHAGGLRQQQRPAAVKMQVGHERREH